MAHRVFISHKREDKKYKIDIQKNLNIDLIDKSLNERIDSDDEDYIMRKIREEYLSDSTVTIFLIGSHSAETIGEEEQIYIKRELQASLFDGNKNSKNGILGVVLPYMYEKIYMGIGICKICGNSHNYVNISEKTVIREFEYNYFIPNNKCAWSENDRYCVLVKWDDFKIDAEKYINLAFDKRESNISTKTKVRP